MKKKYDSEDCKKTVVKGSKGKKPVQLAVFNGKSYEILKIEEKPEWSHGKGAFTGTHLMRNR